jgi:hypothetical protein
MIKRLIALFLILCLCLPAIPALAQDDTEWVDFESEDGLFKISYPEGWIVVEELLALYIMIVSNSEDLFDPSATSLEPADGDTIVTFILLSEETVAMMGIQLPEADLTPEELLTFALENIIDPQNGLNGETLAEEDVEVGEIDLVELGEDDEAREVPMVLIKQPDNENLNFAFYMNDILVLASAAIFNGEIADIQDMVLQIVDSFEFTGTAEDLQPF